MLTRRVAPPLRRSISWKTSLRDSTTESSRHSDSPEGLLKSQGHRLKRSTTREINIRLVPPGSWAPGTPSDPDPPHLVSPFQSFFADYFNRGESRNSSALPSVASATTESSNSFSSRPFIPPRPAFPVPAESAEHTAEPEPVSNPSVSRDQIPPWTDDSRRRPSTVSDLQPSETNAPVTAGQRLWSLSGRLARRVGS